MKDDKKVSFDLSELSLPELIKVYEEIEKFKEFLNDNKIVPEKKEDENDE